MATSSIEIFKVVIRSLTPVDLDSELKYNITQAVYYFEDSIKSQYFKDSVLSFNNSDEGFNKRYSLGLNNKDIYSKIINAFEVNGNIERFTADLFLNVIHGRSINERTIGFVENYSRIINTYSAFITELTKPQLSGHFAHEWSHLLGFGHPSDTGTNYPYLSRTVPYAIANIVTKYLDRKLKDLMLI